MHRGLPSGMTARQQARVGRRLRGERTPIDATSAPTVGDILHAAREKKGVDLYRAERDTKIRARHLAALEDGDYAELPGAVYVKGFLRNYSVYLGLDPGEVLERLREEQEPSQRASGLAVLPPPQPLIDPRRGLTLTPSLAVAAVLGVVVVLFLGYVGMQLFRFSQVPELRLDGGSMLQASEDQTSYQLSGTSPAHATVKVLDPAGSLVQSADAGDDGRWALVVPVQKGVNEFSLSARDPETGRESAGQAVIITVAVPAKPTPQPTPAPTSLAAAVVPAASLPPDPQATQVAVAPLAEPGHATLLVTSPQDGATSADPTISVKGSTDARTVRVTARWTGTGKPSERPEALRLDSRDGNFNGRLVLAPGQWAIEVSTVPTDQLAGTTQTNAVTVDYSGFPVEVGTTAKGRVWIEIFADGQLARAGKTYTNGASVVVVAKRNVVVNTANEQATVVGVWGAPPTVLGNRAGQATWRVAKGKAPLRVQ